MTLNLRSTQSVFLVLIAAAILICGGCGGDSIVDDSPKNEKQKKTYKGEYTWMTLRLPWDGDFRLPLMGETHKKDSDEPEITITTNSKYTIYVSLGSTDQRIYNTVAVRSDGQAIAAYKDPQTYRTYQKKFTLTPAEVAGLTNILIKSKAGRMQASAIDPEENGGTQGGFTLISQRATRRSFFSNSWPSSFKRIVKYINNNILRYSPETKDNGFAQVNKSILTVDPEATLAIRGLLNGK